jgi:hypothetical protein
MTAMPMTSPDRIALTDTQRGELDRLVRAGRTEQRLAQRAGIVLAAADGQQNVRIAASLGVCEDTARKWRHRWCAAPGVSSLGDAKRSGRRPVFSPVQVAQVKALACTPPTQAGQPLSRWSCPELARQAVTAGICRSISPATVRRWLSEDALKPWQYQRRVGSAARCPGSGPFSALPSLRTGYVEFHITGSEGASAQQCAGATRLIVGEGNRSAIGTLVERSTRYVMLLRMPAEHTAEAVRDALTSTVMTLPAHLRRSLTWGQGKEMSQHQQFSITTGVRCTSAIRTAHGNADPTRTPTGCSASTSRRARPDRSHPRGPARGGRRAELNARPRKTLNRDTPAERLNILLHTAA